MTINTSGTVTAKGAKNTFCSKHIPTHSDRSPFNTVIADLMKEVSSALRGQELHLDAGMHFEAISNQQTSDCEAWMIVQCKFHLPIKRSRDAA